MSLAISCHRFFCRCPIGSSENFGALISAVKSLGTLGVLKMDSHNVDICEEAIMRTLKRRKLAVVLLTIASHPRDQILEIRISQLIRLAPLGDR